MGVGLLFLEIREHNIWNMDTNDSADEQRILSDGYSRSCFFPRQDSGEQSDSPASGHCNVPPHLCFVTHGFMCSSKRLVAAAAAIAVGTTSWHLAEGFVTPIATNVLASSGSNARAGQSGSAKMSSLRRGGVLSSDRTRVDRVGIMSMSAAGGVEQRGEEAEVVVIGSGIAG